MRGVGEQFAHSRLAGPLTVQLQTKALELPKEHEMPARDKYTVFSKHEKGYRKGIHKVPKWTRVCFHCMALCCDS